MSDLSPLATTGRVLLVDDSVLALETIGARLRAHGLDVVTTPSPLEALALATGEGPPFDLFILDVMMPELDGHALTRRLRAHPRSAHSPILLLTSLDTTDDRVAGLEAGADDFFTKAVPDAEMLARVRSFISLGKMRAHLLAHQEAMARVVREPEAAPERARVEVLHHQPDAAEQLATTLRASPVGAACTVHTRTQATRVSLEGVDALIVSYPLALEGEQPLLARFGFHEDAPPLLVVDAAESTSRRVAAFDAGADDYLPLQTPAPELGARVASALRRQRRQRLLRSARDRATLAAVMDPLTGLHNRAYFQEALAVELKRSVRYGRPLTLVLMDLDHFKQVNDTFGHATGDRALRQVAGCLRGAARSTDILARHGGEEFAIILPETGPELGLVAAERFRAAVEGAVVEGPRGGSLRLTVSAGVGCVPSHARSAQELFEVTDAALYAAKRAGRNRVCLAAPGETSVPRPTPGALPAHERLRRLLAEGPDAPLATVRTAARMLHEATSPGDPLHALTARLQASAEELHRELLTALDELAEPRR